MDHPLASKERKFKRGQRVRYVGTSWPGFNGVSGTVTGYDAMGFLRIRFDNQPSYEKGIDCGERNIELYDGPPTAEPAEQFIARFTDKEKAAIIDAVSNSDMDGDMRISILDRLEGRRVRKETPVPKISNRNKAEIALAHLKAARDIFKAIDNQRTVERIRAAISSARGAVRIQEYRETRLKGDE